MAMELTNIHFTTAGSVAMHMFVTVNMMRLVQNGDGTDKHPLHNRRISGYAYVCDGKCDEVSTEWRWN
jgi:hypothetical protein